MTRSSALAAALVAAFALHCTTNSPAPSVTPVPVTTAAAQELTHIVIAGTTDLHGWVVGHDESLPSGEFLRSGGLDVLGGYIHNLRDAYPGHVLLVDSGDMFQGTLESNLFEGESVVRAYNGLGYAATAVGNHEFDFGPVGPAPVSRGPEEDPLGALKHNASLARFPFLSTNIYEKKTGARPSWLRPSTLVALNGVKVGVIGATTIDTPVVTTPANVQELEFRPLAPEVIRTAAELRAQGADAIVLLAHAGGACAKLDDPKDASSCRPGSEVMALAEALPPGTVDVIFGGHTHSVMRHLVNGTPVIQAAPMGRGLSVVDLYVDPVKHHVDASRTNMRPLRQICTNVFSGTERCVPTTGDEGRRIVPATYEGKPVESQIAIAALLDPFEEKVGQKKRESLGIMLSGPFTGSYTRESTLGDLIADAIRASVPFADFAVVNSGGDALRSE
jgi:5'-nucleotidase